MSASDTAGDAPLDLSCREDVLSASESDDNAEKTSDQEWRPNALQNRLSIAAGKRKRKPLKRRKRVLNQYEYQTQRDPQLAPARRINRERLLKTSQVNNTDRDEPVPKLRIVRCPTKSDEKSEKTDKYCVQQSPACKPIDEQQLPLPLPAPFTLPDSSAPTILLSQETPTKLGEKPEVEPTVPSTPLGQKPAPAMPSLSRSPVTSRFPRKLWNACNATTSNIKSVIGWMPDGQSIYYRSALFSDESVMKSLQLKSERVASFIRQLNLYGFRKISMPPTGYPLGTFPPEVDKDATDISVYYHPNFIKDRPELLDHCIRTLPDSPGYIKRRRRTTSPVISSAATSSTQRKLVKIAPKVAVSGAIRKETSSVQSPITNESFRNLQLILNRSLTQPLKTATVALAEPSEAGNTDHSGSEIESEEEGVYAVPAGWYANWYTKEEVDRDAFYAEILTEMSNVLKSEMQSRKEMKLLDEMQLKMKEIENE